MNKNVEVALNLSIIKVLSQVIWLGKGCMGLIPCLKLKSGHRLF